MGDSANGAPQGGLPPLLPRHMADLRSSGLTDATIAASRIQSISRSEAERLLGFDPKSDGWAVPYPQIDGPDYRRFKPDRPFSKNGRICKYLSPRKAKNPAGNRLYIPPGLTLDVLRDPRQRLLATEGEKKALAGTQEGFPTVALSGVACWVSRNGNGASHPIADLDLVVWGGRDVYVVFDSDASQKEAVAREARKLALELASRGARVRIAILPRPTADEDRDHGLGGKFGMDDFLKVRGREAFEAILGDAREPEPDREGDGGPSSADLADAFLQESGWRLGRSLLLRWWRDEFYRFTGTHYEPLPAGDLRAQINRWLQADPKLRGSAGSRCVTAILQNLEATTLVDSSFEPPGWPENPGAKGEYVTLANGIIALDELLAGRLDSLAPHTAAYFSLSSLPFPLDPAADCPRWMAFLDEMLPDPGMQVVVREMFGYLLVCDTTLERFFLLEGAGANGKTVVCTVLREILGPSNVCAVGMEAFSAARTFPLAATIGKKANIVEELNEVTKAAEGTLKNFVTGKPMTIERKNRDAFEFTPTARLVFATNVLPRFVDRTDGLWRRMTLIPFTKQILDRSKQDKRLIDPAWWRASGELPAIFLWAIGGLADVRKRGDFLEPATALAAKETYRRESNPPGTFVLENCEVRDGAETSAALLHRKYDEWSKANNFRPLASTHFSREVSRVLPQVSLSEHPRRLPDGRSRVWIGLAYVGD